VPLNSEERNLKKGSIPYWGANGIVDYIDDYIFDEPLLLMAEDGGYFDQAATRPICHLVNGKSWVNNHAHVMRSKSNVLREWVYYWFVHRDITHSINGGTRTKLNQKDLRALSILMPPLPEQKKIAEVLESADDAIAKTEAVITQTERVKQGLLQQLLTRGIGHTKFKQTELGEVPESWGICSLKDVAKVIDCKHRTPMYSAGNYPVVRPRDVKEGPINLSECLTTSYEEYLDLIENHKPTKNDIIYSRNASFGVAAIVETDRPFTVGQDVCIIHGTHLCGPFLYYLLNSRIVKNQLIKLSAGSTFKRINLKDIRNFRVPVPSKDEQALIVKIAQNLSASKIALEQEFRLLITLKQGLMSDLLTGRVRVSIPSPKIAEAA